MAVLTPANLWSDVYKIDTADPVKGGTVSGAIDAPTDGHANAPLQGLANRTEFLYQRMMPLGSVVMWAAVTPPTGWLICNGSTVSRTTYSGLYAVVGNAFGSGDGSTTFHLPDLRGRFVRGYDGVAGVDPDAASRTAMNSGGNTGNAIGSVQDDAFEAHTHDIDYGGSGATTEVDTQTLQGSSNSIQTESTGGNETRPKNAYLNFIIKATV